MGICSAVMTAVLGAGPLSEPRSDGKVVVQSGVAGEVVLKVRAAAPGYLTEVFVKPGDAVKKGQILGHTELAATKYQLDLARQTMENTATIEAMEGQADAWTVTREETEEAVRRRKMEKSRLAWAAGMERFYRNNYQAQLEQRKLQRIHYEYWRDQYEARFFRAPVDGVVTEVLLDPGRQVTYATHVFTVADRDSYLVPVSVAADLARAVAVGATLPVRVADGGHVSRGTVDSIGDDPSSPGRRLIRLLVGRRDLPVGTAGHPKDTKFDVLLPQPAADGDAAPSGGSPGQMAHT